MVLVTTMIVMILDDCFQFREHELRPISEKCKRNIKKLLERLRVQADMMIETSRDLESLHGPRGQTIMCDIFSAESWLFHSKQSLQKTRNFLDEVRGRSRSVRAEKEQMEQSDCIVNRKATFVLDNHPKVLKLVAKNSLAFLGGHIVYKQANNKRSFLMFIHYI